MPLAGRRGGHGGGGRQGVKNVLLGCLLPWPFHAGAGPGPQRVPAVRKSRKIFYFAIRCVLSKALGEDFIRLNFLNVPFFPALFLCGNSCRYFALLALTAALWGAQPLLVKITMRELNPSTMTAVRYLLMSITFFALMRWRGLPLLPPLRLMPALLLMGITGVALNNIAQFTGLQLSTVSNATLIATTTPAVTALVALIFLRERLLPIELLGILLSVAGALFLVSKGQIDVLLHISFNKGDLLFFTAQLGWAVYSLTGFRVMRHLPPLTTTAWAGLFGTAGTFIYAALTGQLDVHSVGGTTLACMVYIVWIGGVCAMIFWNMGVKVVGAGQAAIFLNIMPLVGVVLGVTLLGEDFAFREAFGAVGILGGVYILTHSRQIMRRMDQRLIRRARELAAARRQAAEKESRRD